MIQNETPAMDAPVQRAHPDSGQAAQFSSQPEQVRSGQQEQVAPESEKFFIHKIYGLFQNYFRPRRKKAFLQLFPEVATGAAVLDLGGTASWWVEDFSVKPNVTIVNIDDELRQHVLDNGFTFHEADGRALPFSDKKFDLTFSNSVIEHVGDFNDQARFASEAMRCSRKLYLQTPNKWFPVEPHLMTVGVQWLPFGIARRLLRYFSVWGLVAKPSQKQIDDFLLSTRLLTKSEMKKLFPNAEIREEKFLGLTKSFIVISR